MTRESTCSICAKPSISGGPCAAVRQEVKQLEPTTEADGLLKDLLCATKDATVAKCSALADKKGLFASRYTL